MTTDIKLAVRDVRAGYGGADVLHGVSLEVRAGTIHTLIGVNGAGKTTLLRCISGVEPLRSGTIELNGADVTSQSPAGRVRAGLGHVPENRRVFPKLNIEENIRLGAVGSKVSRDDYHQRYEEIISHFPVLHERRAQLAGSLSGGEQQMLAIAMALVTDPRVLMLDEPSLGLAPIIVDRVFAEIERLREVGTTILLVEQFARRALSIADDATVLQLGKVTMSGTAADVEEADALGTAFSGD